MKRKLIFTLIALIISTALFSLTGTALAERVDFSWLPSPLQTFMGEIIALNPAGPGESPRYYDLLIKKVDTGTGPSAYRAGDIVTAREHGHEWSHNEKANFWIVKMYLTETQVEELTSSEMEPVPQDELEEDMVLEDMDEVDVMRTKARRKYRIPPEAVESLKEGKLIRRTYAEEKSL